MVKQLAVMHERQQHLGEMAVPRSLLECVPSCGLVVPTRCAFRLRHRLPPPQPPSSRLLDAGRSAEAFNQQVLLETLDEAERVELSSITLEVRDVVGHAGDRLEKRCARADDVC